LRDAVRDVRELAALLDLPSDVFDSAGGAVGRGFPLLVPRGYIARMRKGDRRDPLLLQVAPLAAEAAGVPGFGIDPLREQSIAAGGVLRKYARRALLVASGACPVHCRYCFRRGFPYDEQLAARGDFEPAIAQVAADPEVEEVILSGGDPLSLSNRRLAELATKLERASSVKTLRIHTRFPVVLPERVDRGLLALLSDTRLRTVVVIHCNHANELDASVADALGALHETVDQLLNQSVLLHGVNDDVAALAALSERLFACGVLPYYLHLLDPVEGAAHFDVPDARGRELVAELRKRLSGYLVPRLVREVPGELSKTAIA
jgi:EF-P beta-lysylation protein EpmB